MPLIAIVFLLLCAVEGYAVDLFAAGSSADNNLVTITSTAVFEGVRGDYELVSGSSTADTLTTLESGKTFIATSDVYLTLPSAALGLTYTFTTNGVETLHPVNAEAGRNRTTIAPAAGDTIKGVDDSGMAAGDRLRSAGITGDSLTLICGKADTWYVSSINGTWADFNQ